MNQFPLHLLDDMQSAGPMNDTEFLYQLSVSEYTFEYNIFNIRARWYLIWCLASLSVAFICYGFDGPMRVTTVALTLTQMFAGTGFVFVRHLEAQFRHAHWRHKMIAQSLGQEVVPVVVLPLNTWQTQFLALLFTGGTCLAYVLPR